MLFEVKQEAKKNAKGCIKVEFPDGTKVSTL